MVSKLKLKNYPICSLNADRSWRKTQKYIGMQPLIQPLLPLYSLEKALVLCWELALGLFAKVERHRGRDKGSDTHWGFGPERRVSPWGRARLRCGRATILFQLIRSEWRSVWCHSARWLSRRSPVTGRWWSCYYNVLVVMVHLPYSYPQAKLRAVLLLGLDFTVVYPLFL